MTLPAVLFATPAQATNLSNSSTTVNLDGAGSNPFSISAGVNIDAIDTPAFHNAIYGDSTQSWTLTNAGNVLSEGADGVVLQSANGTIVNLGGGLIYGAGTGVEIGNNGTVMNGGLIESSVFEGGVYGILLDGAGSITNDAAGTVAGYSAGIEALGLASVSNSGLIDDAFTGSAAVNLTAGGTVANHIGGIVAGQTDGIDVSGTSGFVSNAGTVTAGDYGIHLSGDGTVVNSGLVKSTYEIGVSLGSAGDYFSNSSTGTIIGDSTGVMIGGYAASSVNNAGTIFSSLGQGLYMNGGGSVTNASTGIISGYSQGVRIRYAAGTVLNAGTIVSRATDAESNPIGVYLRAGGSVSNSLSGYIYGKLDGVKISGTGSVDNAGGIAAITASGVGMGAGYVLNEQNALISGGTAGVSISGLGTLVNDGIVMSTIVAVAIVSGSVTNTSTGLINGAGFGIYMAEAGADVHNAGTIIGTVIAGVLLRGGGYVTNAVGGQIDGGHFGVVFGAPGNTISVSSTVLNSGSIGSNYGGIIQYGPGSLTVTNAAGATITGNANGIAAYQANGNITNDGLISANNFGVFIAGGSITNDAGATISAGYGVNLNGTGNVTNAGDILGTTTGIYVSTGNVTNAATGTISGDHYGVYLYNAGGSLINTGLITASSGNAVYSKYGAGVNNQAGGQLIGGGTALRIGYNGNTGSNIGIVTNDGTISGGTGQGVALYGLGGGTVINGVGATIASGHFAILAPAGTESIDNSGVLAGGTNTAVLIHDGQISNHAGATISGAYGVVINGTGYMYNAGLVTATGNAVYVNAGSIVNASTGTITGGTIGVYLYAAGGSLSNAGIISGGTSSGDLGAELRYGGSVLNQSGGQIGGATAVLIGYQNNTQSNTGAVTNSGVLAGGDAGVRLDGTGGGAVTNLAGGMISGGEGGAVIAYGIGTVTNSGVISGGAGYGVQINAGQISNSQTGTITGVYGIAEDNGGAGTLINAGVISGTATGAEMHAGYVRNAAGGTIAGVGRFGLFLSNAGASVNNAGLIEATGTTGRGVDLSAGGALGNAAGGAIYGGNIGVKMGYQGSTLSAADMVTNGGVISGGVNGAMLYHSGGGTLSNLAGGTISGTHFGAYLAAAGGYVSNAGLITASGSTAVGVDLYNGGTLSNAAGGSIYGGTIAVKLGDRSHTLSSNDAVTNNGVINGAVGGLVLYTTGSVAVTNAAGAVINGGIAGLYALSTQASITNSGTVSGEEYGLYMVGGTLDNAAGAVIHGGGAGLIVLGDANINNAGVISDNIRAGAILEGSDTVTNTGTISGATGLILAGNSAAVINSGVIESTVAGGDAILVEALDPATITLTSGSSLTGNIDGGGTDAQIELQGTNQMGNSIVSFGSGSALTIDAGANWIATGNWTVASVTNNGTFQPGVLGTPLNLTGDFTQSATGVLQVLVTPTTSSQLIVTGNATLGGTLSYVFAPGTYSAHVYPFLTTTGSTSGSFTAVTYGGAAPAIFTRNTNADPTNANLELSGSGVEVTAPVVVAPNDDALFAAAVQALAETTQQDTGLLLDKAAEGENAGAACAAEANVAPDTTSTSGTSTAGQFASIAAKAFCRAGGWVAATGGVMDADTAGGAPHYATDVAGFMTGIDHAIGNSSTRLGFAVGFDQLNLHDDEAGKASSTIVRLGLYASRPIAGFTLAGEISYGFANNSTSRETGIGVLRETNHSGIFSGGVQVNTSVTYGPLTLTPAAGIRFASVSGGGIDEQGGGNLAAFAVTGNSPHYTSIQPYVSMRASHDFTTESGLTVAPSVMAGYEAEAANRGQATTVFAADGTAFSTPHVNLASNDAMFGAGISAGKAMWSVYANYAARVAGNWRAQTGEIGLQARF